MNKVELAEFVIMRSVFVAGGALCVWLAYRLVETQRTGAERLEKAVTDLNWKIADARRAIAEVERAQDRFNEAEHSALNRLYVKLELQAKLEEARAVATKQHERMKIRLKDVSQSIKEVSNFQSTQQQLIAGKRNTTALVFAWVFTVMAIGLFLAAARGWSDLMGVQYCWVGRVESAPPP